MKTAQPSTWQNILGVALKILAFLLWIVTTVFSILCIYLIYQISLLIFGHFSTDLPTATVVGYVAAFLAAFACMVTVIATGEYHRKHAGTRESWTLFAWTIAIELLILILRFVV